jgi:hypothetical protein
MMVQVGGGIVYSGLESGRCVAKVGRKWRNFGGAGAESRTAGGAIRCEKPCTLTRAGIGGIIAAALGVKKEIPD